MEAVEIDVRSLSVSDFNVREGLNAGQRESSLEELVRSIEADGLVQPLVVIPSGDGTYEVVVGQRRLIACRRAGVSSVPCIIRDDLTGTDARILSLVENVHRADMHPLDKARALKQLHQEYGTIQRVAEETAWSSTTVSRYLRLLELPEALQEKISTSEDSPGVSMLAQLSSNFSGDAAVAVFEMISGFNQRIQKEIIRRSEGHLERVDHLTTMAMEGAFDVRRCGGAFRCHLIREIVDGELDETVFSDIVEEIRGEVQERDVQDEAALREAARSFFRSLALGEID